MSPASRSHRIQRSRPQRASARGGGGALSGADPRGFTPRYRPVRERRPERGDHLERPRDGRDAVEQQEVWSLTGHGAIQTRTEDVIAEADSELLLLVVEEDLLTAPLVERLQAAADRGATVIVGGATPDIAAHVEDVVPVAQVFETELDWLVGPESDDEVAISRVLLADRETLLVGSFYPYDAETTEEQAIIANGLHNGVVVLLRRLITTDLLSIRDPGA